jgi:hypothetical protein
MFALRKEDKINMGGIQKTGQDPALEGFLKQIGVTSF